MQHNVSTRQVSDVQHRKTFSMDFSIAIIVRTKNRPHLLTRSLQSLAEQQRLPNEVIVVNDGGVAIEEVVRNFTTLNIQLINNVTNQGRARAGNQGVQATNSDVIGFLDDDDRFLSDHLQRLEKSMLYFDARVAYSGCRLLQRDMLGDKVILQEQAIGQFNDSYDAKRLRYENYIPLINLLIDRALWLEIGGFDEAFDVFEDWDVLLRLSIHTPFYHLNRITTEYAIWGKNQATQASDQARWREAYRQFLEKHLMPLPQAEQLKYLAEYWRVSQERRGTVQETTLEKQALQLQLIQNNQTVEQLQSQLNQSQAQNSQLQQHNTNWATKYEQLQLDSAKQTAQLHTEWNTKYERLQSEHTQSQSDWMAKYQQSQSDWTAKYQQLQLDWATKYQQLQSESAKELAQSQSNWSQKYEQLQSDSAKQYAKLQSVNEEQQTKAQETFNELEKRYFELQTAAQQEHELYQLQQNTLHELSKQIAVGLNQETVDKIRQSQPGAYVLATTTETVVEDYQRLVNWVRDKAGQLNELEHQLTTQNQPLYTEYQNLRQQLSRLAQLISASHWPQIRRYANFVQDIDNQVENLFSQTEHYIATSTDLRAKLGLSTVVKQQISTEEIPSARPLSDVYPTFMCIAGSPEDPQFMEGVNELGTVPFQLNADTALVFSIYCPLDNFFRFDILLATYIRINTCQVRIIIRDLNNKTEVLRILYLEALECFDNRFQPISFEPITDSAGKTYQIEMDSPNANEQSAIAAWCHPKKPAIYYAQQPPDSTILPHTVPFIVQQNLLDLPLSKQIGVESAPMIFMVWGITESTPVLNVQIFLRQLGKALEQSNKSGQVLISGQISGEVQQYCQQHQLAFLKSTHVHIDLPFILDRGKTQTAEYLWCCELAAIPQIDIVERAMEIFDAYQDASMLVPLEKYTNGSIRAGYASLIRDGLVNTISAGSPADHPYYGYRRTLEAASSQLVILKIANLSSLDSGEIAAYRTPIYQLTELIWQLKEQQNKTFYEAALCYEHDQPYPEMTEPDYTHDNHYFYQRWQNKLPTHTAPFTYLDNMLNPDGLPTVLVIDATLPMFDEDSGSLRLYTLLKIWTQLGYRITFFPDNLDSQFKYRHALEALGIEVFHSGYGIQDAIAHRQFDFAFISRVEIGHRYIPFVRLFSPDTIIFYDTVDIHYIREQRQAEIEENPKLLTEAQATKRLELSNCLLANRVITVTEDDAAHLQKELPHLTSSVIPNIHQLQPLPDMGFEQREGLVFIGNYNHHPNEDAVYSFIETVLPKIHALLPDICLYVIGSNMKEKMKTLTNRYIKIVGWVDFVEPEFAKRRIFVSYLRYGAGMKGKLGQALSLGLPVVTTTIGAEGMGLIEKETALIADEPDKFAEAVCHLYTNAELWEKLSRQGREFIEQHYGEAAVRDKLLDLLNHNHNYKEWV